MELLIEINILIEATEAEIIEQIRVTKANESRPFLKIN
nr:MAG TPA: hypothetical protein [Caudoviricetes sp.]